MRPLSVYIHIPYCESKCIYCDFYSVINGKNIDEYFSSLKKEIEIRAEELAETHFVSTVFFGGGTPSFVKSKYILNTLEFLISKFKTRGNTEITIEANPGTLNNLKLKDYLAGGINRISVGVQSFFDDDLALLTRIHTAKDAIETVEDAFASGFENISIDLIFNLPRQTSERWQENLEKAIRLSVKHVSAYSLIVEKGTVLYKMISEGKIQIGAEDYGAGLYEITQDFLHSNGYEQYEVSNFALRGFECKHNLAYWHYRDYIGIGTAAHSFVNNRRWKNYSALSYYINGMKSGNFVASYETLSAKEQIEEYVMLSLRSDGLRINDFESRFGEQFLIRNKKFFDLLTEEKLIEVNNNLIKFTKKGYALCDEILLNFNYG